MSNKIKEAIDKLGADFPNLNWNFVENERDGKKELISQWLGEQDENIMVCAFKGKEIHEKFHRQDFFFINYAYEGDYGAQSYRFDNHVTIHKDECYIGQPYSGYALYGASDEDIVIVGILIKKEIFYRTFLKIVSGDKRLFHFFLDPEINEFSDEYIHFQNLKGTPIRTQIELMVMEYANKDEDTGNLLMTMAETLILMLSRENKKSSEVTMLPVVDQMLIFMEENMDQVTLSMLSSQFGYHPAYISSLISGQTGRTFSQILLGQRMERAIFLMKNTDLSIEEIAPLLGYPDKSNFHKAFREYYGQTPRQYIENLRN